MPLLVRGKTRRFSALLTAAAVYLAGTTASHATDAGAPQIEPPVPKVQFHPAMAKRLTIPASATVEFEIDQDGAVTHADVIAATDPDFAEASCAAVLRWKYQPGRRGGHPSVFRVRQTFSYEPPTAEEVAAGKIENQAAELKRAVERGVTGSAVTCRLLTHGLREFFQDDRLVLDPGAKKGNFDLCPELLEKLHGRNFAALLADLEERKRGLAGSLHVEVLGVSDAKPPTITVKIFALVSHANIKFETCQYLYIRFSSRGELQRVEWGPLDAQPI